MGQWSPVFTLPLVAISNTVLPDGRLAMWSRVEDAALWNWRDNTFKSVPAPTSVFCATQSFLTDGRMMVAGGHITDDHGLRFVNLFDPRTSTWAPGEPMRAGRERIASKGSRSRRRSGEARLGFGLATSRLG